MSRDDLRNRKQRTNRQWLIAPALMLVSGCAQVSALRPQGSLANQRPAFAQNIPAPSVPAQAVALQSASAETNAARPMIGGAVLASARLPRACPPAAACLPAQNCPPVAACPELCNGPAAAYWNDQEYLYDGGDRDPRVELTKDRTVNGLDPQDTIAHYETVDGKLCVAATNRVPIYAPRFGAVRKVAAPVLSARAVGAERMTDPRGPLVKQSRDLPGDVLQPLGPKNQAAVKLIDGLHGRIRGVPNEKIDALVNVSNLQVAFQQLNALGSAVKREDLEALLGEYLVNARTWANVDEIAIMIGGVAAAEVRDAKQLQDVTLYETEPGKCSLRICKAASHSAAQPGDIVQFSIRFDNVGAKPLQNIVILDSLTTRLEYIDGSQICELSLSSNKQAEVSKSVRFSTAENEAGSTVLKWDIDQPLATGDSGVITFRCRVR